MDANVQINPPIKSNHRVKYNNDKSKIGQSSQNIINWTFALNVILASRSLIMKDNFKITYKESMKWGIFPTMSRYYDSWRSKSAKDQIYIITWWNVKTLLRSGEINNYITIDVWYDSFYYQVSLLLVNFIICT